MKIIDKAENEMELRDWFAGQAAASIIGGMVSSQISTENQDAIQISRAAHILADAMMEARK